MKLRTHIALALLIAAVAVPAAHAERWGTGPNPRGGAPGPGTVSDTSDVVSRYLRNHTQQASRADTSDVVSRYLRNHTQALAATTLPARNGAGFDWTKAAIGAGGLLGIILLAGTATLLMRQTRTRVTSA
jgi:hypothetical protein